MFVVKSMIKSIGKVSSSFVCGWYEFIFETKLEARLSSAYPKIPVYSFYHWFDHGFDSLIFRMCFFFIFCRHYLWILPTSRRFGWETKINFLAEYIETNINNDIHNRVMKYLYELELELGRMVLLRYYFMSVSSVRVLERQAKTTKWKIDSLNVLTIPL